MELNEAVRRILGVHWRLVVFFVTFGIGVAAVLHVTDVRMYTASARMVLDTQDPQSRAESVAIVDTARAIATSPADVSDALSAAHVSGRDAVQVAEHRVSVRGLGSSGVFQLSVSDRDPLTAAAIANTLAAQVIRARLSVTEGQARQILTDLGRKIDDLSARISYTDARIESLNQRIAGSSDPETVSSLRRERDDASRLSDFLGQQRAGLEAQRTSVLSDSLRPKPTIISRAERPTRADSSGLLPDVILGALLGLILGVGVAGIIETFRPTLVGAEALAREFRAPLLGTLTGQPDAGEAFQDGTAIAMRLRLAAEAASLRGVGLVPIGPHANVGSLAERLDAVSFQEASAVEAAEPGLAKPFEAAVAGRLGRAAAGTLTGRSPLPVRIRPFEGQNASLSNGSGGGTGLVLVVPSIVKKTELAEAGHLLTVSRLPLLGLITYARPRTASKVLRRSLRA
jgi:capsular polysaccharide biosynthesis protein